ncbi:MAG: hypothetical protein JMM76_02380 [Candidatus Xiphinematobacter sp.]|nr:MAG: hypothetical protein JMM76_02380 [Candidatus Xiphinematobacter sp.]QQY11062.1 MAG: hypothetical protein JMM77_02420 [Candidatus Xiphinematobacter sp.]
MRRIDNPAAIVAWNVTACLPRALFFFSLLQAALLKNPSLVRSGRGGLRHASGESLSPTPGKRTYVVRIAQPGYTCGYCYTFFS